MSNRLYDVLNKIERFLPAIGIFYLAIAKIWGFPFADEINQTIAALATLLGTLLEISTAQYLKQIKKTSESFSDQNHIEG
jgi:hypothetical protein